MQRRTGTARVFAGITAALLAGSVVGCSAGVKEEKVNSDLQSMQQQLESEMHQGDQQVRNHADQRSDSLAQAMQGVSQDLKNFRQQFNAKINKVETQIAVDVPVHFGFDSTALSDSDTVILDQFASVVKSDYPHAVVTVEGFADPQGPAAYNIYLGRQRAKAVKDYLVKHGGLASNQIKTVSYGEARDRQVNPGAHGPGRPGLLNRRVSLVIDDAHQASPESRIASESGS